MTTTQDRILPDVDQVALVLAALLEAASGWSLPEPGLISITSGGNGQWPREIDLQFSGPDEADEVRAWADRFGVPVDIEPSKDGTETWHRAEFRFHGVDLMAYASVKASQP
jgi:hypothetical protein